MGLEPLNVSLFSATLRNPSEVFLCVTVALEAAPMVYLVVRSLLLTLKRTGRDVKHDGRWTAIGSHATPFPPPSIGLVATD